MFLITLDLTGQTDTFGPQKGNRKYGLVSGFQPYPEKGQSEISKQGVKKVELNLYRDNFHLAYLRGQIPESVYQSVWFALMLKDKKLMDQSRVAISNYLKNHEWGNQYSYADERRFLTLTSNPKNNLLKFNKDNTGSEKSSISKYEFDLNNELKEGDKIRAFVYLVNASKYWTKYADYTSVTYSWTSNTYNKNGIVNLGTIKAVISSESLASSSSKNESIWSISGINLPENLTLRVHRVWETKYNSKDPKDTKKEYLWSEDDKSILFKYNVGDIDPGYGTEKGVYLDLIVTSKGS